MTSIKWCCTAFVNLFLVAGDRSIAVLVERDSEGRPEFILQSRAFSQEQEPPVLDLPVPISRIIETGLNFCPWCSVSLSKWYKKHIDALRRPGLRIEVRGKQGEVGTGTTERAP